MVALIVTVCALLDGADCHDETFYFESHGSLNVCMYEAPLYLAQWGRPTRNGRSAAGPATGRSAIVRGPELS